MKREPIDLHYVKPEHLSVHARLLNWGAWSNPRSAGSQVQPIFRGYEPYLVPRESSGASEVDPLDAQAVQKVMHRLPKKHALSMMWCYVHPYISDRKMMWQLSVNRSGLAELIQDARTMVKNNLQ